MIVFVDNGEEGDQNQNAERSMKPGSLDSKYSVDKDLDRDNVVEKEFWVDGVRKRVMRDSTGRRWTVQDGPVKPVEVRVNGRKKIAPPPPPKQSRPLSEDEIAAVARKQVVRQVRQESAEAARKIRSEKRSGADKLTKEAKVSGNQNAGEAPQKEEDVDLPGMDDALDFEGQDAGEPKDEKTLAEKVAIVGIGQAGSKLADQFWKNGYRRVLILNTTDQDMKGLDCPNLLVIGAGNAGAGKNPAVGQKAAETSTEEILRAMRNAFGRELQRVIVCSSAGGGTGSGATPAVIDIAKRYMEQVEVQPRVGAIVVFPKKSEGGHVAANAKTLTDKLKALVVAKQISPVILMDNEQIGKMARNLPVSQFFDQANKMVVGCFHTFNALTAEPSKHMTLDPADFRTVLDGGVMTFGMTRVPDPLASKTVIAEAVQKNLSNGMLSSLPLKSATHAGAMVVSSDETLGSLTQETLDLAFEALGRAVGGSDLVLHQGVYDATFPDKRALVYVMASGMKWE